MTNDDRPLSKGDPVSWNSHGQHIHGTVEERITEETEAAGRVVKASPNEPQYKVKSAKSGRAAVHKPGALKDD